MQIGGNNQRIPTESLIIEGPGHASETADRLQTEHIECASAEIKGAESATRAAVLNLHGDALTLIRSSDGLAADRVGVGVHTVVAREGVEQILRDSTDHVGGHVRHTACTEADGVEGSITSLSS